MSEKKTKQSKKFISFFEISANKQLATNNIILIADHARNQLPKEYGTLGLKKSEFSRHIAYDIGVESLTRHLSQILNAPAVLCGFSRLLIDPNRGEDDPTLIRQLSDGTIIHGNYPLSLAEKQKRIELYYRPYDQAISRTITKTQRESPNSPFIISLHSFTPTWRGEKRPWHIGVLWDSDTDTAKALIQELKAYKNLTIGDNEPYQGGLQGDTLDRHCTNQQICTKKQLDTNNATQNNIPHILIEIRQDLIADEKGAKYFANLLAPIFLKINPAHKN